MVSQLLQIFDHVRNTYFIKENKQEHFHPSTVDLESLLIVSAQFHQVVPPSLLYNPQFSMETLKLEYNFRQKDNQQHTSNLLQNSLDDNSEVVYSTSIICLIKKDTFTVTPRQHRHILFLQILKQHSGLLKGNRELTSKQFILNLRRFLSSEKSSSLGSLKTMEASGQSKYFQELSGNVT